MRKIVAPTALLAGMLLLAGCGSYSSASGGSGGLYGSAAKASSAATGGGSASADTVDISGFAFSAITVKAGATVTVRNADAAEHTLTIAAAGIDVKVPAGGSASFTAPAKAGTYALTCDFHHSMHGTLTVSA